MWSSSNIYITIFMLAVMDHFNSYIFSRLNSYLITYFESRSLPKQKNRKSISNYLKLFILSISISEMNEKMICRYLFLILKLPKHRLLDLPIKKWPKMWTKQPRMTKHEIWIFRACTSWWLIWNIVAFIYQMICFNVFI